MARTVISVVVLSLMLPLAGCERHTKAERFVLDQALDLVQREERSRLPTKIEVASLSKDKQSICGYATVGDRKHVPYIIRYSKPLPEAGLFATVSVVLTVPPYKGAPYESQAHQAARILAECAERGHHLPPPT